MFADIPRPLARARVGVSATFLLYGTILGTWTARIPAIKQKLALSDGHLSIALLAFAAGAIIGMQTSGPIVDRLRSTKVMVPAVFADGLALIAPAYSVNLATLAVGLLVFGTVHGMLNVAMNVNAVEIQRAWGRPIISSCHAIYSIGGFIGAAIGGGFAYAHLGATATFVSTAALVVFVAALTTRWVAVPPGAEVAAVPAEAAPAGLGAAPLRGVLFLGVLAFCCLVGEGAAADWSAVYLRDNLHTTAGFAATAYAVFALMMTAGRSVGDQLALRLGPVRLVQVSGLLASAGLAICLLVDEPIAGVLGFGCLGAGLSCIAPQVFSAAGNRHPARAGNAIARVASLGFLGFVVGPVVIGSTAQVVGLPKALAIPALLALFVALAAPALRTPAAKTPEPWEHVLQ
ncbi:MAG: MFS transporter [Acidothermaceae bacterium]